MSKFTAGMRVRVKTWQQQEEGPHTWRPREAVVESVAYSLAEERQIITVAFDHRVRLPVRAEDLQPITEEA